MTYNYMESGAEIDPSNTKTRLAIARRLPNIGGYFDVHSNPLEMLVNHGPKVPTNIWKPAHGNVSGIVLPEHVSGEGSDPTNLSKREYRPTR